MAFSRDFKMGMNPVTSVIEIEIQKSGREKIKQVLSLLSVIESHGVEKAKPYAQQAAIQLRKSMEFYPAPEEPAQG